MKGISMHDSYTTAKKEDKYNYTKQLRIHMLSTQIQVHLNQTCEVIYVPYVIVTWIYTFTMYYVHNMYTHYCIAFHTYSTPVAALARQH